MATGLVGAGFAGRRKLADRADHRISLHGSATELDFLCPGNQGSLSLPAECGSV